MKLQNTLFALAICTFIPTIAFSGDFMSDEEREAAFRGNSFDGENVQSGWKFKVHPSPQTTISASNTSLENGQDKLLCARSPAIQAEKPA